MNKSVKSMLGFDAPKTLKEKLAALHDDREPKSGAKTGAKDSLNKKASQQSLLDAEHKQALGENSIEMLAVKELMAETDTDGQQQGNIGDKGTLAERWLK